MMLKVHTYPLGPIGTNCYIVMGEDGKCLIIDPGAESKKINTKINKLEAKPIAILLTHAHFDHIGAVDQVRDRFKIPVLIHEAEKDWLLNPNLNGSSRYPGFPPVQNAAADAYLEEGIVEIGPFTIDVRHTPGHSPGSVSFVFHEYKTAIVGDTLFKQSIGRTDLPGGNTRKLLSSIHEQLLSLDDDYTIYPGHGFPTTPGEEKDSNPFLNGF